MKKIGACLLMLCVLAYGGWAFSLAEEAAAEPGGNAQYTNVPGTPTQESLVDIAAQLLLEGTTGMHYDLTALLPDELTMDALTDIYNFVLDQARRPARYFPEDVQAEIARIIEGDPDILHMTEFLKVKMDACQVLGAEAVVDTLFDVDYRPGQLIVVVLGDGEKVNLEDVTEEELDKVVWTPLPAEVTDHGNIHFEIPPAVLEALQGKEVLLTVLTPRVGGRGGYISRNVVPDSRERPSKDVEDMTVVEEEFINIDGQKLPDDFEIFIAKSTLAMQYEIQRMRQFMVGHTDTHADDKPLFDYFSAEVQNEARLLLRKDLDPATLLAYEIKAVACDHYVDTYGDAIAGFKFATPYKDGQEVVTILGVEKEGVLVSADDVVETYVNPEDTLMEWQVQRTKVENGFVKITFEQLVLPIMEQESVLIIILSEPLMQE